MITRLIRSTLLRNQLRCFSENSSRIGPHAGSDENGSRESRDQALKKLLESSAVFIDTKPQHDVDKWSTLPYAEGTLISKRNSHELDIERPKIDPRDTSIILFPSDEAYFIGMAKTLDRVPAAKDLFDYASEVVKYDVLKLCNNGPKSQLANPKYGHVSILTASLGSLELLREERPNAVYNCVGASGFGLGEITALVFAGALQFEQAIHLVQIRAEAIQAAAELHKGGMAEIRFGADSRVMEACKMAREWCKKNNVERPECWISKYTHPNFKVISGCEEALQYLERNYQKFRLRSIRRIDNMPACHSVLMDATVEPIRNALEQMDIDDPIIWVYSNINCRPYLSAQHIRNLLPHQLKNPVKWEQLMTRLYARRRGIHYPRTIMCGPGFYLRRVLKRVNLKAWQNSIHDESNK